MASDKPEAQKETDDQLVLLQSKDGEMFKIQKETMKKFIFYKDAFGLDNPDQQDVPIPIKYESDILKLAIEWVEHHINDPPFILPVVNSNPDDEDEVVLRSDDISEWDNKFLDIDKATLFRLLDLASYLQVDGLRITALKKVANMIKGKTPEELRTEFNIPEKNKEQIEPQDDDEEVGIESKEESTSDEDKLVETESKEKNIPEDGDKPVETGSGE